MPQSYRPGLRGRIHRTRRRRTSGRMLILVLLSFSAATLGRAGQAGTDNNTSPSTPAPVLNRTATLVEHYNPNQTLRLAFALKPPHLDEERQLINQLHDKKSPQFHKFLTAEEWNARFAPSAEDEQAVVDWAQSQGLSLTHRYPNRLLVDVEAPAGTIEKALNITVNKYEINNVSFFSNDRDPLLPTNLSSVVWAVLGLNSLEHEQPVSKRGKMIAAAADYVPGPF